MMSFCVVPWRTARLDAVLLRDDDVERQQPRRRGVDRHRRVHPVERDPVQQRVHVALVRDRARRPCRPRRGPARGRRRSRSGSAGRRRSTGPSAPWRGCRGRARWTAARARVARVGAHHPRAVGLGQAVSRLISRVSSRTVRVIDVNHLGREQVIGCWEVDGVLVDPGPQSCEETLLAALDGQRPRALLLTHIHFDHAGAAGRARAALAGPAGLRPRARRAAPGRPRAARRQRGAPVRRQEGLRRLWGEVVPGARRRTCAC